MYTTKRNIATNIILAIVTCGIWGLVWSIQMIDDVNLLSGDSNAPSGIIVILLSIITCGIYLWFWLYKAGEKMDMVRLNYGLQKQDRAMMYLLFAILGLSIVSWALIQSDLNAIADMNMNQGNFNQPY